jgi:hypothetical protein
MHYFIVRYRNGNLAEIHEDYGLKEDIYNKYLYDPCVPSRTYSVFGPYRSAELRDIAEQEYRDETLAGNL